MSEVSQEKIVKVENTTKLLKEYEVIGAADLHKVGSGMLQDLRKQLRGKVKLLGIKNKLMISKGSQRFPVIVFFIPRSFKCTHRTIVVIVNSNTNLIVCSVSL